MEQVSKWHTYKFGWSQVKEQIIRCGGFNMKDDGVIPPFSDIRAVTTQTVTTRWYRYFNLESESKRREIKKVSTKNLASWLFTLCFSLFSATFWNHLPCSYCQKVTSFTKNEFILMIFYFVVFVMMEYNYWIWTAFLYF